MNRRSIEQNGITVKGSPYGEINEFSTYGLSFGIKKYFGSFYCKIGGGYNFTQYEWSSVDQNTQLKADSGTIFELGLGWKYAKNWLVNFNVKSGMDTSGLINGTSSSDSVSEILQIGIAYTTHQ